MSTGWKVAIVVTALVAALAAGIAVAAFFGLDAEIAQSGDPEAPIMIDLTKLMLQYNDPLRGMSGSITYRQVFQDALWYRVMHPHTSEDLRAECFMLAGILHEGRAAEVTPEQYAVLMSAVQEVWGPAIVAELEAELR